MPGVYPAARISSRKARANRLYCSDRVVFEVVKDRQRQIVSLYRLQAFFRLLPCGVLTDGVGKPVDAGGDAPGGGPPDIGGELIVHRVAAVARPDDGEPDPCRPDGGPVQRAVVGADVDAAHHDDSSSPASGPKRGPCYPMQRGDVCF